MLYFVAIRSMPEAGHRFYLDTFYSFDSLWSTLPYETTSMAHILYATFGLHCSAYLYYQIELSSYLSTHSHIKYTYLIKTIVVLCRFCVLSVMSYTTDEIISLLYTHHTITGHTLTIMSL